MIGTRDPNGGGTYYYGGNQYHARFQWEERNIDEDVQTMVEINGEDRKTVRASKSKSSGYTGLIILYKLRKLYGFDFFKDFVIDLMHNIQTNVIAAQLKHFIDAAITEECLCSFPWTAGTYKY